MNNFCTVVMISEEGKEQLEFFLKHYREHHPHNPIHIISDGVPNKDYPIVCAKYKADYTLGKYCKRIECGGLWWRRALETGLKYNKKWIIKADPDTKFCRPFTSEPKFPVAGTHVNPKTKHEHIQGGCQVIRYDIARKILNSKVLDNDDLIKFRFCPDSNDLTNWIPTGYFTTDHSLTFILRKLKIAFGDWSEIGSGWRTARPNQDNQYAVTHPHKITEHKRPNSNNKDTPLTIITTCKGRKKHLEITLPLWLAEPNVKVVVVDYDCPDNVGNWVEKTYPQATVARVHNEAGFHLARARNIGAKHAGAGWLAFMDADIVIKKGWADKVRETISKNRYLIANPLRWGMAGSCVIHSDDFTRVNGYDELFKGWAGEDMDLYARLRQIGVRPGFWDGNYADGIKHTDEDRTKFYSVKDKTVTATAYKEYSLLKHKLMIKEWRLPTYAECKKILTTVESMLEPDEPCPIYPGLEMPAKKKGYAISEMTTTKVTNDTSYTIPSQAYASAAPVAIARKPMVNISVLNYSTIDLGYTLDKLCTIGMDYLNLLANYWPGTNAKLIPTKVILPNTHAIIIMDDADHNQSKLGFKDHTPDGFPLAKVFAKQEMIEGVPVTVTFTHELGEFRADPNNSRSAVSADGTVFALEIADPVDDDDFVLHGVPVANFVLPTWFEAFHKAASTKFDYMGILSAPFSLSQGGYATVRNSDGQWQEIFGSHPKSEDLASKDRREWRGENRKVQCHASTRHAHANYLNGRK